MPKDDDITKAPWYGKTPTEEDLKEILADHKAWVKAGANGEPPHDLRGIDLSKFDLTAANLSGAILTEAVLRGAVLRRAVLRGAVLIFAKLFRADLAGAHLGGAVLAGASLAYTNLGLADLPWAELTGADLTGADLTKANLTSANLAEADLTRADLRGAELYEANVDGADFRGAKLEGAKLLGVDLSKAITDENTTGIRGIRQSRVRDDIPEDGLEGEETDADGPAEKEPPPSKPSSEEEEPLDETEETEPPLKLVDKAADSEQAVNDATPPPLTREEIEEIAAQAGTGAAALQAVDVSAALRGTDSQARVIAVIDKAASLGRKLFTPLLIACAYTVLTSLKTNNGGDSTVKLPVVQVEMEAPEFYIFSALLLLALHVYFLFYFTRLLENITLTPDVDARGVPRSQLIDPWLVLGVVRVLGPWSVQRPTAMDWAQFPLVVAIVWFPVPITMGLVWWACLCRGDWTLTLIQVSSLTLSLIAGVLFFLKAADILERWKLKPWKVALVVLVCLAVGALLSWASQLGFPADPPAAAPVAPAETAALAVGR